jgi:hypothetical protein
VAHIVEIQADGYELEFIKNNFTNIPHRLNSTTVIWVGNIAKFIICNLMTI